MDGWMYGWLRTSDLTAIVPLLARLQVDLYLDHFTLVCVASWVVRYMYTASGVTRYSSSLVLFRIARETAGSSK
jgi:hypothetical protein